MELTDIHSSADLKGLSEAELEALNDKLRAALLVKLSRHGGHIGPNLGVVEATLALHYVFDFPTDKIVYDVSHQSYVHKMLTGRMDAFVNPADYDKVSGYTNPDESAADLFKIGHTSTSLALAAGLAKARDLKGGKENVIAFIGDGSLSGGEAFEGFDYAATLGSNFIVVVNDNEMSIAENHGGLYENLRQLRVSNGTCQCNFFKAMGFDYRYVAYGNDLHRLIDVFREVKDSVKPVVVHIHTQKGEGFAPAEADREHFHYGAPFDITTGAPLNMDEEPDYGDITADALMDMMKADKDLVAITAGTPGVIGFTPERRAQAGEQFVDVGIAEQAAVALASGIARGGGRPFFGVVSSFIQRAYDQLSQDLSINGSPAVIGIFYGTVLGMNDVTHLGWFDIALVSNIPGIVYLAPTCKEEYLAMLGWAMKQDRYPVALRVPGCKVVESGRTFPDDYSELDRYSMVREGTDVAIIAAGSFFGLGEQVADTLAEKDIKATLINPRYLSGLDREMLSALKAKHRLVITLEDGILDGGFGEKIARYYGTDCDMMVRCYGLKKEFADRYDYSAMMKANHLDPSDISEEIISLLCNS